MKPFLFKMGTNVMDPLRYAMQDRGGFFLRLEGNLVVCPLA